MGPTTTMVIHFLALAREEPEVVMVGFALLCLSITVISIVGLVQWRKLRELATKQDLLAQGLTVGEIEQLLTAGSRTPAEELGFPSTPNPRRTLRRARDGRIAGVCAGVARYFDVDPTFVRVIVVLIAMMTAFFPVLLAYGILALVIPPEWDQPTQAAEFR